MLHKDRFLTVVAGFLLFIGVWLLIIDMFTWTSTFAIYLPLVATSFVLILIKKYRSKKAAPKAKKTVARKKKTTKRKTTRKK